jgi:hypothetical protein
LWTLVQKTLKEDALLGRLLAFPGARLESRDIFPSSSGFFPVEAIVFKRDATSASLIAHWSCNIAITSPKGYGTIAVAHRHRSAGSCVHGGTIKVHNRWRGLLRNRVHRIGVASCAGSTG